MSRASVEWRYFSRLHHVGVLREVVARQRRLLGPNRCSTETTQGTSTSGSHRSLHTSVVGIPNVGAPVIREQIVVHVGVGAASDHPDPLLEDARRMGWGVRHICVRNSRKNPTDNKSKSRDSPFRAVNFTPFEETSSSHPSALSGTWPSDTRLINSRAKMSVHMVSADLQRHKKWSMRAPRRLWSVLSAMFDSSSKALLGLCRCCGRQKRNGSWVAECVRRTRDRAQGQGAVCREPSLPFEPSLGGLTLKMRRLGGVVWPRLFESWDVVVLC